MKFYLCRLHINFCMLQRCILCSFSWNFVLVFVQNISKNANYEEFLIKFVNTNNYTHNFTNGVIILQDAKSCSQHAKIFEAWQKLSFFRVDKKGSELLFVDIVRGKIIGNLFLPCTLQAIGDFYHVVNRKNIQQLRNLSKRPFWRDSERFIDAVWFLHIDSNSCFQMRKTYLRIWGVFH